ncbi:MAG: four helix bundle protein [Patescibacteria group bacterium]
MSGKGYFRFEKLDVWIDARQFVSLIYKVTEDFPAKERFGLIDQIRRAAVSIALNIAEGSTKNSDPDFRRFLRMSQGSVNEVVTALYIALDQKFIKEGKFDELYEFTLRLNARLNALIKSISH